VEAEMNFPVVIDNSMRKTFVACPTKFMRKYAQNLKQVSENSVNLHFGKCFASGIEIARKVFWEAGSTQQEAIEAGINATSTAWNNFQSPPMSNKTLPRLIGALRYYFEQWPLGEDGLTPVANGIECSFAIDLPIVHPQTGLPLKYAGRFDMLAADPNDRWYVVDEKTTSRLGDSWFMQWDMDAQMTGYIWAVKQGAISSLADDWEVMAQVRGLSILKNDYGHAEVNIVRSTHMIEQWHQQLLRDVRRMVESYKAGEWDKNLSNSCTEYARQCEYAMLCKSADPAHLIEGNFKEEVWNPLLRS
jgi:PD-(D/E)XK nuclease superfamily protein